MSTVYLALYWHHHQPYYPDDVSGETLMPWVRLHGVKDYWGMAAHLEEYGQVQCTVNFVPSLLCQLLAYVEDGAEDRLLRISRVPADGLSREDALWLLEHAFTANRDQMIRPFPRYFELLLLRSPESDSAQRALTRFKTRDLRDLQVWANLAWVHPLAVEVDADLAELRQKGCGFSEEEKKLVLDKHTQLLSQIVGKYRALAERGQIELTTSPYFHPIIPLLIDRSLARAAMPDVPLPRYRDSYAEDAWWHMSEAVRCHEEVFGRKATGMWPPEGSVCQAMVPKMAELGIKWTATDEQILSQSLGGRVGRDEHGFVRPPELLYRPWRVVEGGAEVAIVFRDHALSDLIGFDYQRMESQAAVDDFVGKLKATGKAVGKDPALISVILDGENCWEYYPNSGVQFLRRLYATLANSSEVRTTRLGDYIEQHPPRDTIKELFPGSWINHNFAIWIGHEEDRRAWERLHETREFLIRQSSRSDIAAERVQRAWRELYVAEGSDWFWWYGDEHSSSQDLLFDYLFRKHLQNVYTLLGVKAPPELLEPILRRPALLLHTEPRGLLEVQIDGRYSYFEWIDAGRYVCGTGRGTMSRTTPGRMAQLFFGFDVERFYLRVDCRQPARLSLVPPVQLLRVEFVEPADATLCVHGPSRPRPAVRLLVKRQQVQTGGIEAAVDRVLELAMPLTLLGLKPGDSVKFFVELVAGTLSLERAPEEGLIDLTVPAPEFDLMHWQV